MVLLIRTTGHWSLRNGTCCFYNNYLFIFHSGCSSIWPKADWLAVRGWIGCASPTREVEGCQGRTCRRVNGQMVWSWKPVGFMGFRSCFVNVELQTFCEIESCKMCSCWTVILLIWNLIPYFVWLSMTLFLFARLVFPGHPGLTRL